MMPGAQHAAITVFYTGYDKQSSSPPPAMMGPCHQATSPGMPLATVCQAPALQQGNGAQHPAFSNSSSSSGACFSSSLARTPPGVAQGHGAGARNPFAAMPRELRNNQLRNNLQAVAEAFTASCSTTSASSSPPTASRRRSSNGQQYQWPGSSSAAAAAAAGQTYQPSRNSSESTNSRNSSVYAASGLVNGGASAAVTAAPSAGNYSTAYQAGACAVYSSAAPGSSNSAMTAYSNQGAAQQPLSLPLYCHALQPAPVGSGTIGLGMHNSGYTPHQQQGHMRLAHSQQKLVQQQQQQQQAMPAAAMYSDPLPYLAMPRQQQQQQKAHQLQQQQQQQHQVLLSAPLSGPVSYSGDHPCLVGYGAAARSSPQTFMSEAMAAPAPPPVSGGSSPSSSSLMEGDDLAWSSGHVQQLLQRQQALQALEQMVQQQLLQLLPDV